MMDKTAIIFDLDGTLIHSAPDLHAAINVALQSLDRGPLDLPVVISFIGNGVEKLVERSLHATGGADDALHRVTLARFMQAYAAKGVALTEIYPGVLSQLKRLKAAGIRLGICTNKPEAPAQHICDALNLSPFFDVVIGARPDQPKKPHPAALKKAMTALGSTVADTLYVGDTGVDFETARAAGVDFWLFTEGYLNAKIPPHGPVRRFSDWADATLFQV